jgi:hypothetical protein
MLKLKLLMSQWRDVNSRLNQLQSGGITIVGND